MISNVIRVWLVNRVNLYMAGADHLDHDSSKLARRTLFVTLSLCFVSSMSGVLSARVGMVAGAEVTLVVCSSMLSATGLVALFFFSKATLQTIATLTTVFLAINLATGMLIAICGPRNHINLLIYLFWFFPVLVFNKLVNEPRVGRLLAKIILATPILIMVSLVARLRMVFTVEQQIVMGVFCIAYCCYALTLNLVSQYRERYIVEQERTQSLKVATDVLESISDAFISLDFNFRLIYLNDAACTQFGLNRRAALNERVAEAAPNFFSEPMLASLRSAAVRAVATIFEAQNKDGTHWYDLRCFPRRDGMSVYFRDITKRKANAARIEYLAFYDVLTKLPNRQSFRDRLNKALATAAAKGGVGALLYIDLDDFKKLNETMGHDRGDMLLQQVANRVVSCVDSEHTVARVGGDQFIVLLEGLSHDSKTATAMAEAVGDKILACFRTPFVVEAYESEMTASIGATVFSGAFGTVDNLLKRCDLAMFQAKAQGRNRIRFFDAVMQTDADARGMLRFDLSHALPNGEFELHYQPQIDGHGIVVGAEALLRWNHPSRGRIPPTEFIPLAEEAGLIVDLGQWVLETACTELSAWASAPAMEKLTLAVNVSVRQFFDPQFLNVVMEAVRVSGANPQRLRLEMTESSVMEKVDETIAKMQDLKTFGIGFSLDDFGTGYSSLSYLRHLPLEQLKIDRSFVKNVLTDAKDASITRTLIALGRSLNLSVLAEGVESAEQRDFLMAEGCDLYQGFLYSPALSSADLEAFVTAFNAKLVGQI
jgi:diguanylate cyclase (GGDEF)-like protein/PAS domain S-box-containing protein